MAIPPFIFGRTQEALQTPFEPARNPDYNGGLSPFVSVEAQSAIEEAYYRAIAYAATVARFCLVGAFDGNGTVGRWLAYMQNNPSNLNPFVWPRAGKITELSYSTNGNSTSTCTLFKNAVSTGITISTAGTAKASVTGLNVVFAANDSMSVQLTAGSANRPQVYHFGVFT